MIARIGMASSLDVFTVNGLQYIKTGEIEQSQFGGSTLYQASMKLTQKTTIGINVDNIGSGSITPPPSGTLMYVGVVTEAVPTESQVKAITGITAVKTNQTKVYTMTNSRFCFAYPASYGSLTSIIDTIGDEIISGFAVQTLTFTTGGVTMNYNVYTLVSPATVTSFTVIFKF